MGLLIECSGIDIRVLTRTALRHMYGLIAVIIGGKTQFDRAAGNYMRWAIIISAIRGHGTPMSIYKHFRVTLNRIDSSDRRVLPMNFVS